MSDVAGDTQPLFAPASWTREDQAVDDALLLIGCVRDLEVESIANLFALRTPAQVQAMAVALAAMVDDTKTVTELLGWTEGLYEVICDPDDWGNSIDSKARHATRSRYNAGCRGKACKEAQRRYDRERYAKNGDRKKERPTRDNMLRLVV